MSFETSNLHRMTLASTPLSPRLREIWAVGGGKGGVGKSLISTSLAIALARTGQKVIAVDLDLGGANLHTTLGLDLPQKSLSDFLTKRVAQLSDCVVPSSIPHLSLISGAQDSIAIPQLSLEQSNALYSAFRDLDADYLIFDLGAGTGASTIEFFLEADVQMITMLPEPTSIENAYRFLKAAYYQRLRETPELHSVRHLIDAVLDPKNARGIKTPSDLFREVSSVSPEFGLRMKQSIHHFRPQLILNQVRTQADIDIGFSVKGVTKRYFGLELDFLGYLDYDSSVWQAVRRKKPFMVEFPQSPLVANLEKMAHSLLKKRHELNAQKN